MIKQPSILIVDDNADSRLAVIAALRKKEYLFYEAKDGEEGVALARKHLPSVIIMDINMPKLNGYEALELLKADSNTEAIPVIIVTAIGSMDEKIVALEKGADGLWSKPFDRKILLEQIESLIKLKKLQNESLVALENTLLHRQSQELIRYYYTDSLTSLPNRSQLIKNLEQQTRCGLILIDIDSFKDIVYFYGHAIGDAFLKAFVARLISILPDKRYKFYRISGDIFAVLVQDVSSLAEIAEVIEKIKTNFLKTPYLQALEHEISIRITLGGSVFDGELLISAEKALNIAKKTGREALLYEENELFRSYENNIVWVNKISDALACDRIIPFFQSIVNNQTQKIEKYESLVRLIEKDGSVVSPYYFLEISKKSRQYGSITKTVVKKAFETFRDVSYSFSINLSVIDILNVDIAEYIFEQLEAYGDCCRRVIFELLESEGVENYTEVFRFIEKVKGYGCSVAIDDFGSGYSNFIHLVQLNVDIIKIDGSLIRNLDTNHNARLVVETIVSFAKKLGVPTVAEFVHSQTIYDIVRSLGIDYSQGYYFAQPEREIQKEV